MDVPYSLAPVFVAVSDPETSTRPSVAYSSRSLLTNTTATTSDADAVAATMNIGSSSCDVVDMHSHDDCEEFSLPSLTQQQQRQRIRNDIDASTAMTMLLDVDGNNEQQQQPATASRSSLLTTCISSCRYSINIIEQNIRLLATDRRTWPCLGILAPTFIGVLVLFVLATWSNSLALQAYAYLISFAALGLLSVLMSIWVGKKSATFTYPYGYERAELLLAFTNTIYLIYSALFVLKESIERMVEFPLPVVSHSYFVSAAFLGILVHCVGVYYVESRTSALGAPSYFVKDALSSLIIRTIGPGNMHRLLLGWPPVHVRALTGVVASVLVVLTELIMDLAAPSAEPLVDALMCCVMVMLIFLTITPVAVHNARILLQTTPLSLQSQLDKCLREASTFDGVLECRDEHFWSVTNDQLVGSLHVRIRRNADEQHVLTEITNSLSKFNGNFTVQVFKDDWVLPAATHAPGIIAHGHGTCGETHNDDACVYDHGHVHKTNGHGHSH